MAQLKISDLSVGDWVEFHRTKGIYIAPPLFEKANARVIGTHRGAEVSLLVDGKREFIAMPLSAIHPIPITPEILEKNGFAFLPDGNPRHLQFVDGNIFISTYEGRETFALFCYNDMGWAETFSLTLRYIHQLQHALRLAGVEKEIEL